MPLAHAILATLEFSPMTGYDLKKFFDQSIGHFWSCTQSHIYKALDHLETQGWVQAHLVVQAAKPNRNEYHITPAGSVELLNWLAAPLPVEPVREAWLIQIFFAHRLSNQQIARLVEARIAELQSRLQNYTSVAQAALDAGAAEIGVERLRQLWQITLDYGIAYYQAELAWNEQLLNRINQLAPLTAPDSKIEEIK